MSTGSRPERRPLPTESFRLELSPTAARNLYDALYAMGENIAAGEPLPEFDAEMNTNLGELLKQLSRYFGGSGRTA